MMHLIAAIIQDVLDAWEMDASTLSAVEIIPGPGAAVNCWYVHMRPHDGEYACVTWLTNYGLSTTTHGYLGALA